MGKITIINQFGLPQSFVRAVEADTHWDLETTGRTISVTSMIGAPQVRQLRKKHDLEIDVVDRIYAMLGTATHHIIEMSNQRGAMARKILELIAMCEVMRKRMDADEDSIRQYLKHTLIPGLVWLMEYIGETKLIDGIESLDEHRMKVEFEGITLYGTADRLEILQKHLRDYKVTSTWGYKAYMQEKSRHRS